MSIYDQREKPAYRNEVNLSYANNPLIMQWWSPAHDQLIEVLIKKYQWCWWWEIYESVVKITEKEVLENWIETDPLCRRYAWNNILMHFSIARAEVIKVTKQIRSPQWKICGLCHNRFIENSLPFPLVKRLGIDRLEFCAPCLRDTVLSKSGYDNASEDQIKKYIRGIYKITGVFPNSNYYVGYNDLLNLDYEQRLEFLKLLKIRPSNLRVKEIYNSWANAYQQAGIIGEYLLTTSRGIHTVANDGHLCLSLGERTIDDFLYEHGIEHEKEPSYPDSNFRADFRVGDILIEYFGMAGDPEYDKKTKIKKGICRTNQIQLISIYPNDLRDEKHLERKLAILL